MINENDIVEIALAPLTDEVNFAFQTSRLDAHLCYGARKSKTGRKSSSVIWRSSWYE
jgi:hypothetical protein